MPTISKIRIVNFVYDDGKRFFLDEIINLEDSEFNTMDTYLNLINGGGKSVLVQLILQNIIPRATVQGRKIDSFFRKSTDHCFVLTEWRLDTSADRLMTGIAIAAGVNTGDDNDKAARVKYYTFYNQYDNRGDKNDIVNMPLSKKDKGRFCAASYEEIRSIVKSGARIKYFSSDDVRRYQSEIEEYGIIHSEWENVISKINNIEGGIEEFFKGYKTSDSLLDNFIIPGIIGQKEEHTTDEDSSSAMMFKNYADSFSKQNEKLSLRNKMADFIEKLKDIQPEIKELWTITDEYENAVSNVFDFIFSASKLIKTNEDDLEQVVSRLSELEFERKHIELERISNEFYIAEGSYKKSKVEYEDISEQLNETESSLADAERTVKLLLAAKEYQTLSETQADYNAVQEQIKAIENNNVSDYAAKLKYSLHIVAKKLLTEKAGRLKCLEKECEALSAEYKKLCEEITLAEENQSDVLKGKNISEGRKDALREIIDSGLKSVGITISENLFERYPRKKLDEEEQNLIVCCMKIKEEINQLEDEIAKLENQFDRLCGEETGIATQRFSVEQNIAECRRLEKEYTEKLAAVRIDAGEYSLVEEDIYSGIAVSKLKEYLAAAKDELNEARKKADTVNEQLEHAKKGQLHIPKSAVDFLEGTGIDYQTGEKYLLGINAELKEKILSAAPQTAFAVIVENAKDKESLLTYTDDVWVSAVVPVFTYSEINDILNGAYNASDSFISAYSREYFGNNDSFVSELENKLEAYKAAVRNAEDRAEKLQHDKEIISAFEYDAYYFGKLMSQICEYEEKLAELKKRTDEISAEKAEISKGISEKEQRIGERKISLNKSEQTLEKFKEIIKHTEDFSALCNEISQYEEKLASCKKQLEVLSKERTQCKGKIDECNADIPKCSEVVSRCEHSIKITENCTETELIDGEYNALEEMYKEYFDGISENLTKLSEKLERYSRKLDECEANIAVYGQAYEEYSKVEYSPEKYRRAESKQREFSKQCSTLREKQIRSDNNCEAYQKSMEKCLENLRKLGGELLELHCIVGEFELRLKKCKEEITAHNQKAVDLKGRIKELYKLNDSAKKYADRQGFAEIEYPKEIECTADSLDEIKERIDELKSKLRCCENEYKNSVHKKLDVFSKENVLFEKTVRGLCEPVDNEITGDKYFTLNENLDKDIIAYCSRIQKLDIELADVTASKNQLVENCLQRGREIYDGLIMLSKKSKVKLAGGEKRMIDIKLPENIDHSSETARLEMSRHIDEYVQKFLECTDNTAERERSVAKCMNLRSLLDCYIGNAAIPIKVYKIDSVQSNSGYRTWERALTDNSGGEKFVVFFALILSMMNYSRGIVDSLKKTSGVLIMDNPFGPISSAHLLKPMFDIAHHFRIQLICLSHLDTADILNCFRNVYQLRIKKLPLSSYEVIEAVQKEGIEHAFYRTEQISLF